MGDTSVWKKDHSLMEPQLQWERDNKQINIKKRITYYAIGWQVLCWMDKKIVFFVFVCFAFGQVKFSSLILVFLKWIVF